MAGMFSNPFAPKKSLAEEMQELQNMAASLPNQLYGNSLGNSLAGQSSWPSLLSQQLAQLQPVAVERTPVPTIDTSKLEKLKCSEPRKALAPVPDMVAPIVAWRGWAMKGGNIAALGTSAVWEPKKMLTAKCEGMYPQPHIAPQQNCSCGMWAFKSLESLIAAVQGHYEVKVLGQVSLWGRVIETENGFRAQYAYPKELWLLDETLEHLGYTYNVPIRTA